MQIATLNERVAVTAAATRIALISPSEISSLALQNLGANIVELGAQGITYGAGFQLGVSEVLTLSWEDFPADVRASSDPFEIWGICDAAKTASVQVMGWAKRR
jgi:hypothetical protein